jgi:Ca2+-binding EF-hand superfamily protein
MAFLVLCLLLMGVLSGHASTEEETRTLHTQFDADADGVATEAEVHAYLSRQHRHYFVAKAENAISTETHSREQQAKYWSGVVKHLDTNVDGKLSKEELPANHHLIGEFTRADHSGDGFLTTNELSRHQETADFTRHLLKDAAANLLAVADESKDGGLSVDEFARHRYAFAMFEL